jgi:hypothetical protein
MKELVEVKLLIVLPESPLSTSGSSEATYMINNIDSMLDKLILASQSNLDDLKD